MKKNLTDICEEFCRWKCGGKHGHKPTKVNISTICPWCERSFETEELVEMSQCWVCPLKDFTRYIEDYNYAT